DLARSSPDHPYLCPTAPPGRLVRAARMSLRRACGRRSGRGRHLRDRPRRSGGARRRRAGRPGRDLVRGEAAHAGADGSKRPRAPPAPRALVDLAKRRALTKVALGVLTREIQLPPKDLYVRGQALDVLEARDQVGAMLVAFGPDAARLALHVELVAEQ